MMSNIGMITTFSQNQAYSQGAHLAPSTPRIFVAFSHMAITGTKIKDHSFRAECEPKLIPFLGIP